MFYGFRKGNVTILGGGIRLRVLAVIGWLLGITFHVRGVPFGADTHTDDIMRNPSIEWEV